MYAGVPYYVGLYMQTPYYSVLFRALYAISTAPRPQAQAGRGWRAVAAGLLPLRRCAHRSLASAARGAHVTAAPGYPVVQELIELVGEVIKLLIEGYLTIPTSAI